MFGLNRWWNLTRTLITIGIICVLVLSAITTNDSAQAAGFFNRSSIPKSKGASATPVKLGGKISETSPPEVLQQLRQELEDYQPQVSILSPKQNEVLQDNAIDVQFQVKDLPIFKDEKLGLGPHLHIFVDNQPYTAIYDTSEPLILRDLSPGTHTIRAFASRPWHESFKNEGAYAQSTFHIFTKTQDNNPNPDLPLLTYSRPQGNYGAEPIMLDFYLTNAPLHFVAQEDTKDDIADWRIRCTINGSSFVIDRWQPLYLKGFKPGKNWVQLEYLDEQGNPVNNVFNNTVRLITYEPNGQDTLSKLARGDLSLAEARSIVDPNYRPEPPTPEPAPEPIPSPVPETTPTPTPTPTSPLPEPEAETEPIISTPTVPSPTTTEAPEVEATPSRETPNLETTPETEAVPSTPSEPETRSLKSEKSEQKQPKRFFDRFRRPAPNFATPAPATSEPSAPSIPPVDESSPVDEEITTPLFPSEVEIPQPDARLEVDQPEIPAESNNDAVVPLPSPEVVEETPVPSPEVPQPSSKPAQKTDFKKYFDRFRRPAPDRPETNSQNQLRLQPEKTEPTNIETHQTTDDSIPLPSQNGE